MQKPTHLTVSGQSETARAAFAGAHEAAASLYIHVPFCLHKCHYCDFYSVAADDGRQGAFVEALEVELRMLAAHAGALETVFIGGGTPTHLRPELLRRMLAAVRGAFDLTPIDAGRGEFTVECNPETATPEVMDILRGGGVDRLSVGAQSFHPHLLRTLERRHEPERVGRALGLAAAAGIPRLSVDLIFAIPGQSLDAWELDLDTALALPPGVGHVSCYALTYEPNTAMTRRVERGEFRPVHEDDEAAMYELCVAKLESAGYARYEVSNFARAGAGAGPSLHNLAYWRQRSWLAAGPSASAHLRTDAGGWRWRNAARITDWIESVTATGGYCFVDDLEAPDRPRALRERVMTGLRIAEGLELGELMADADAIGRAAALQRAMDGFERVGLLSVGGGRLTLTARGFLMADGVAGALMASLEA